MKRYIQALKILTFGIGIYPDADALYEVLALVNMKNGDRKQAFENIRQCLKLNPEKRSAKILLKNLLMENLTIV
jgi:tetratricopeptide (TPR) repeat protein